MQLVEERKNAKLWQMTTQTCRKWEYNRALLLSCDCRIECLHARGPLSLLTALSFP